MTKKKTTAKFAKAATEKEQPGDPATKPDSNYVRAPEGGNTWTAWDDQNRYMDEMRSRYGYGD